MPEVGTNVKDIHQEMYKIIRLKYLKMLEKYLKLKKLFVNINHKINVYFDEEDEEEREAEEFLL